MSVQYHFRKDLYSKEAFIKSAYNFIDDFYLHLDCNGEYYIVDLEPRRKEIKCPKEQEFLNEMLIQETRRMVNEKTMRIREIMYARAMASTVIDDPVESSADVSENAERILVDWFESDE